MLVNRFKNTNCSHIHTLSLSPTQSVPACMPNTFFKGMDPTATFKFIVSTSAEVQMTAQSRFQSLFVVGTGGDVAESSHQHKRPVGLSYKALRRTYLLPWLPPFLTTAAV